jgi:hypothetical protein
MAYALPTPMMIGHRRRIPNWRSVRAKDFVFGRDFADDFVVGREFAHGRWAAGCGVWGANSQVARLRGSFAVAGQRLRLWSGVSSPWIVRRRR